MKMPRILYALSTIFLFIIPIVSSPLLTSIMEAESRSFDLTNRLIFSYTLAVLLGVLLIIHFISFQRSKLKNSITAAVTVVFIVETIVMIIVPTATPYLSCFVSTFVLSETIYRLFILKD